MRKPAFCYTDSTIPLLPKSEISSLLLSSVVVHPDLSDLVGDPKDRFSYNDAHLNLLTPRLGMGLTGYLWSKYE